MSEVYVPFTTWAAGGAGRVALRQQRRSFRTPRVMTPVLRSGGIPDIVAASFENLAGSLSFAGHITFYHRKGGSHFVSIKEAIRKGERNVFAHLHLRQRDRARGSGTRCVLASMR
jgi:predicted GNAT superfamily acetyltransferase